MAAEISWHISSDNALAGARCSFNSAIRLSSSKTSVVTQDDGDGDGVEVENSKDEDADDEIPRIRRRR